jgi:hypothetical protein
MIKPETRNQKSEAMASRLRGARRRWGFAFTEVLFAVMVLGIGFIMIAAMFPVTIRQTQNTMQDVVGANEAKAALAYMQTIASDTNFPPTVPPFPPGKPDPNNPAQIFSMTQAPYLPPASATLPKYPGYVAMRGNFVNPNNPRIAWVPVYRRGIHFKGGNLVADSFAQVFVFAIQSRNRTQYYPYQDPGRLYSDFDPPAGAATPEFSPAPSATWQEFSTLSPRQLKVVVQYYPAASPPHGELTIPDPIARQWAAPGAYVIIASDPNANAPLNTPGQSNGRVYQLGNPIDEPNGVWNLAPGSDMIRKGNVISAGDDNDIPTANPAAAYMIGRGYTDPFNAAAGYSGPAQDIAVYTGFIQIPP